MSYFSAVASPSLFRHHLNQILRHRDQPRTLSRGRPKPLSVKGIKRAVIRSSQAEPLG